MSGPVTQRNDADEPLGREVRTTFWWAVGMSAFALVPATVLALSQRRERRAQTLAEARSPVG